MGWLNDKKKNVLIIEPHGLTIFRYASDFD